MRFLFLPVIMWLASTAPSMANLCYNSNGAFSSGYNNMTDDIMNGYFNVSSSLSEWRRYYSVSGHCRRYYRNGAQSALNDARDTYGTR